MISRKISRRDVLAGAGALALADLSAGRHAFAADSVPLRIASVKFGSVSWLLETMKAEGLDKAHNVTLDIVDVPTNQAGPVALLAGGADVIVSDWTWAMRQRSLGEKLKFAPYSTALGAVVVPDASPIKDVAGLEGKLLGVAGSNIDKSWLLLRAYTQKKLGRDIASVAKTSFGAPPLLSEEIKSGRIDAVLNFWTFVARLEGAGFRSILTVEDVMKELGIDPIPPLVGFIYREEFEAKNPTLIANFLKAANEANGVLLKNDAAWTRLKALVKPQSDAEMASIIAHYRAGVPKSFGDAEIKSAERLMDILVKSGDAELLGQGTSFDSKLFRT